MGHLVRTNSKWNTITTHFCCNYGCLYHTIRIERQQIWKLSNHMIEHYPQTQLKRTTLPSQSVLYVHKLIFALNEEAFINHFLKCSRTVCANNAPPSDNYVTIFITHPPHINSTIIWLFQYTYQPVCHNYFHTLNFH